MYLMLPLLLALRATTVTAQFIGGYALFVNRTCPTGTLDCGPTVEYSGSPHACCPTGQVCHKWEFTSYGFVTACCATEKECREELEAANVCATDTWNLYIQGENHQFCCTPDLVGYATDLYKGYGKCVPRGTELEVGDSALNVKEQGLRGDSTSTPRPSGLTSRIGTSTQTSRGDATTTSDPSAASGLDRISTGTAPTVTVTGGLLFGSWWSEGVLLEESMRNLLWVAFRAEN
ncbi:hypothetical protein Dda_4679 [Drechslerella dactyloides]|uniref:Uncharacterized protein n=1 Tax=Drechslerella dactyloides TaxID=74499 RepID=A0AAD6NKU4_DREDA|nr:hypothetical protein Dda_4679 [Drechslerella dactyloides]